jgi:hypothetical protein
MIEPVGAVAALLVSLFEKKEMIRLARQFLGQRNAQNLDSERSRSERARRFAEALMQEGNVEEFFKALLAARPKRAAVIEKTRDTVLGSEAVQTPRAVAAAPPGPASAPAPAPEKSPRRKKSKKEPSGAAFGASPSIDEERQAWRDALRAQLQAVAPATEEPPRGWVDAAALLPDFDPLRLRPLGADTSNDGLTQLAGFAEVRPDGRWALQLRTRRDAIARLCREGRLQEVLAHTEGHDAISEASPYRSILKEIAATGRARIDIRAGYDRILAAREIGEWFATSGLRPFNLDQVATLLERHESIEPLRKLTGMHFRGRVVELRRLRKHHQGEPAAAPILTISGLGGSGKSALLGKLLLELESGDGFPPPWVYLDFDHPEVDPAEPSRLIELIARRLGLLYAGYDHSRLFHQLESASAGDSMFAFDLDLSTDAPLDKLIDALDGLIRRLPIAPSLLLVFDTYEQVQVRGRAVESRFVETIRQILAKLPYTRVVLSGRSRIDAFGDPDPVLLGDLDPDSADAVLEALGVMASAAREAIVQAVGTSPLSLNLAAAGLKAGRLELSDLELLAADVRKVEIQGRLYTRILGHITDAEVRRLAHPGLIVRRLTPAIIRDVLAEVCEIDPARADALFDRLPNQVWLFEHDEPAPDEPRALRHRQDVREFMIELMLSDPAWQDHISLIHDRAILHYQGRSHPISRGEELYHRLMRNDEPDLLDPLWSEDLLNSLGRSRFEPFPERARAWLAYRLGDKGGTAAEALRQADWEAVALRKVRSHLQAKDPAGALAILAQRAERIAGSPLIPLEAEALRRTGQTAKALDVSRAALGPARAAGKLDAVLALHLLAAELAIEREDTTLLEQHATQARELARRLQNPQAELQALELIVRRAMAAPQDPGSQGNVLELERAFAQASPETLQAAPEIAGQVVKTLGAQSKNVLKKAASTFGNRPDQTVIQSDVYQLADLLRRVEAREGGNALLGNIAKSVGLPSTGSDVEAIANNSIRFNRQGDTLVAVLDAFGDDADVLSGAAGMFFS